MTDQLWGKKALASMLDNDKQAGIHVNKLAEQLKQYNALWEHTLYYMWTKEEEQAEKDLRAQIEAQGFYLIRIYTDRVPPQTSFDYSGEDMIDLFVLRAK